MGKLLAGDVIFGEHGQTVTVTHAHPVIPEPECFRLTFSDGTSIDACGDHRWLTFDASEMAALMDRTDEAREKSRAYKRAHWAKLHPPRPPSKRKEKPRPSQDRGGRQAKRKPPPTGSVRTTKEIRNSLRRATKRGEPNHAVPLAGALQLPDVQLPIHPYVLGAWLGDGNSRIGRITSADPELVEHIRSLGYDIYLMNPKYPTEYNVWHLNIALRALGVLRNKHIPTSYLRAGATQRLELLRGLMDTDGYCDTRSRTEFTTTSPRLRDGFVDLACGLGFRVHVSEGRATLYGKDCGPKYRIGVTSSEQIFRLKRKVDRYKPLMQRRFRFVTSVDPIDSAPMRCITVDNPTGLFLVGKRYLVTHNTQALLLDAGCYSGVEGWVGGIFRHNHKDLKGSPGVFAKAKKMFSDANEAKANRGPSNDPSARVRFRESYPLDLRWPSGATLEFRHLDEENYLDYQGLELAWIGLEEATHYEWHWVRYLITRLRTDTGVQTLVRMTCNPDKNHWLRQWVDWYLLPSGYPDREKSGVLRYMAVKSGTDDIVWADTREECAEKANREEIEVQSFSYIAALFDDNKILKALDPKYVAKMATGGHVDEERLRRGNWNASHDVGGMLRKARWGGSNGELRKPIAPLVKWCRAWDKAATKPGDANPNPDFTAGVLLAWDIHGRFYVVGLAVCRDEPPEVTELQRTTARADGKRVIQCAKIGPADTGKSDWLNTRKVLVMGGGEVRSLRESASKTVRLEPMADALAMGMRGNVAATTVDEPGQWLERGWILNPDPETAAELGIPHCADWFTEPYEDNGTAPPTLGDLFWSQVDPFFNPKRKKDIPDAMGDAYSILTTAPKPKQPSARDRLTLITRR
jgi:hypothetical protein